MWVLSGSSIANIQYSPKVLGQFVNLTKSLSSQSSSHPMKYNQFSAKNDAGFQTIWIEDQARFVGPDLDLYGLKRSLKSNVFSEIV